MEKRMKHIWVLLFVLGAAVVGCDGGSGIGFKDVKSGPYTRLVGPVRATLEYGENPQYVTVSLALVVKAEDRAKANKVFWARGSEILDCLILLLVDQEAEDFTVAGGTTDRNLEGLRRKIHDELNKRLWPNKRGLIQRVLFRDVLVQSTPPGKLAR